MIKDQEIINNVNKVIDVIEKYKDSFDMSTYIKSYFDENAHICKTPACIAGFATFCKLDCDEKLYNSFVDVNDGFITIAAKFFGLPFTNENILEGNYSDEINKMFGINKYYDVYFDKTHQEAIDMLKYYLQTGKVDWSCGKELSDV